MVEESLDARDDKKNEDKFLEHYEAIRAGMEAGQALARKHNRRDALVIGIIFTIVTTALVLVVLFR